MTTPRGVSSSVAVADPGYPDRVIKPNADGSINVVDGGSPTAPSYVLDGIYTEKGYQQITNLVASTALTVPSGAIYALVGFFLAAYLLTFAMADDDVSRINREANRVDRRTQPLEAGGDLDGVFDCEDYALLKRRRLIEAGVAPSDLRLWAVTTSRGTRHMVLEAKGMILDNLTPWAIPREDVTYYTNWSRR